LSTTGWPAHWTALTRCVDNNPAERALGVAIGRKDVVTAPPAKMGTGGQLFRGLQIEEEFQKSQCVG
jgi:hypothetical protein